MLDPEELDRAIDNMADKAKISEPDSLLETAEVLARLQTIEPSSERRAELREQFLVRGQEFGETQRQAQGRPASRWRLLTARRIVATAAMLLLSSGSVVYAATDSMPNSPLYPIKRTSETIALSVVSEETQSHLREVFARRRVQEARYLIGAPGNSDNYSSAIPLLVEARKSGDAGLKNQVDELLKMLAKKNNRKAPDPSDSGAGSSQSNPRKPAIRSNQPGSTIKDLPKPSLRNGPRPAPGNKS